MTTSNKKQSKSILGLALVALLAVGCDEGQLIAEVDQDTAESVVQDDSTQDADESEQERETPIDLDRIPEPQDPEENDAAKDDQFRSAILGSGWSAYISKNTPPKTCNTGQLIRGAQCRGGWCKNIRLQCQGASSGKPTWRTWTSYFSEEKKNWRYCPHNTWMSGLVCRGKRCNDIAMECTHMGRAGRNCRWSGWFSEEDPAFSASKGHFIRGIQCGGNYCDNKRYYHCQM